MPANLTFSVAISTFNRNEDLFECLNALSKQTYPDFDIIIVNGGDSAGVREAARQFPSLKIKVVDQEKKGIVEARNLGWIRSVADIVCLIDDDLIVSQEWLANIRDTFLSDAKIGGVSGPTIIPQDRLANRDLISLLNEFRNSRNIFLRPVAALYCGVVLENKINAVGKILRSGAFTPGSNYKECLQLAGPLDVDYLEACHMCFRRSLLERIGGFDYAYKGIGDWSEPDLCFKIRGMGYRLVFNPKAAAEHHISQAGVFKARTNSYDRSRNFVHFYLKRVKPDTWDKVMRFGLNLSFINLYWCYKFLQTGRPGWLSGIWGTLEGLLHQG